MTAREQFLAALSDERRARVHGHRTRPTAKGRACPRCRRPRGWLCEMGRPCEAKPVPRYPKRSHASLEAVRRRWLRKYGAL